MEGRAVSDAALIILAGGAGGLVWMAVTAAATWWFNRRARADLSQKQRLDARVRRYVGRRLA